MYWVIAIYGLFNGFFSLKHLIQITVRHSTKVGLEGKISLEGMSLQGTEAPTPGQDSSPWESPEWRRGRVWGGRAAKRNPCVLTTIPFLVALRKGEGIGRSWVGQVKAKVFLPVFASHCLKEYLNIYFNWQQIHFPEVKLCLALNSNWWFPCLYLNPEASSTHSSSARAEWVAERKLDNQPRETHQNQPNLPRNTPGLSNYITCVRHRDGAYFLNPTEVTLGLYNNVNVTHSNTELWF